ncbi:MAG: endonuclease/exonuclease/phosphatase family protein [Oscillospiraceae bacterium]|jgi:endonuclease/exonuclease/phosphatase family metal-dependent hydrolase|nr:endonuclease/exonuclease/phosphatase family protein [Oscillospiraceae bacterium]
MTERAMNLARDCLERLLPLTSRRGGEMYGPPNPPAVPARADAMAREIAVMSFNVYCRTGGALGLGNRYNGVVRTIRGGMPDSFGLQEAHELWRVPLKRDLADMYGVACNKGRVFGFHEGAPVFYRKDKYELVREGVFWLSENPEVSSVGWDAACPRIAGWAVLQEKNSGFRYAHFNTHLDHIGPVAMANGARLVADRINALGLPAVLTGDLNCEPGSVPMEYLKAGGLADLRFAAKDGDTGPTFHAYGDGPGKAIDYVYANHYLRGCARFQVIRDQYDGMYPSDHYAVAAALTLAN